MLVHEGDQVKKGDILLHLESVQPAADVAAQRASVDSADAAVKSAEANVVSSDADVSQKKSDLEHARIEWDRGQFTPLQSVPTLPGNFAGHSTAAEISVAPLGRFLYGSNRGHDSLAIFGIDQVTGHLTPIGWELTQGRSPRYFELNRAGTFLYVANQDSDSIVMFRVDQTTGRLTPTGHVVKTGSPSTIAFR